MKSRPAPDRETPTRWAWPAALVLTLTSLLVPSQWITSAVASPPSQDAASALSFAYDLDGHVPHGGAVAPAVTTPDGLTPRLSSVADGTGLPLAIEDSAVAAEAGLPELSASRAALEAKFKHAGDFGVTEGRGAAGFDAYGKAVDAFVRDSSTTRIVGTYRGDPAILNYNASTAHVVVQDTNGTFISGWQMSPAQLQNVIERGSLGGG